MINFFIACQNLLDKFKALDFLGPLLLRAYLAPVFWAAGSNKIDLKTLRPKEQTVHWFGNPEWGLGMPFPEVLAFLAGWSELGGAIALAVGLATRWATIPLMVTMLVAAATVHWQHGWQAIADPTVCLFNCADAQAAAERLAVAKRLLREHGNYDWLTEQGSFVVLNSGIEFAATYFVMLLVLFFFGAGRYLSVDYWIDRRFRPHRHIPRGAVPAV